MVIIGGSSMPVLSVSKGGDDLQGTAAVGAVFGVDVEDPLEQPGPAHARRFSPGTGVIGRGARWRVLAERERFYCTTSRWMLARHGSESECKRGRGTSAARALHEFQRFHDNMGGAVFVRTLQLQHDLAGAAFKK